MLNRIILGHLAALFTTTVWGVTYVSTKYLVAEFRPAEILLVRLLLAILILKCISPQRIQCSRSQEFCFAMAGLTGICAYFMLENTALTITTATNVGIIVSSAPLFTALLAWPVLHDRTVLSPGFAAGFLLSMTGILLLSLRGSDLEVHPAGDLMVVAACVAWAAYSLIVKKTASWGFSSIAITRRAFMWGVVTVLPFALLGDLNLQDLSRYTNPLALGNLAFLGTVASAACFVSWNFAVKVLGPVRTCVYIYTGPAVTVLSAMIFLGEQLNCTGIFGCLLTVLGLILSSLPSAKRPATHSSAGGSGAKVPADHPLPGEKPAK